MNWKKDEDLEDEYPEDYDYEYPEDFKCYKEIRRYTIFCRVIRIIIGVLIFLYVLALFFGLLYGCIKKNNNIIESIYPALSITFCIVLFILFFKRAYYSFFASGNKRFLIYLKSNYEFYKTGVYSYYSKTRRSKIIDYYYTIRYKKSGFVDDFNDNKRNIFKMEYCNNEFNTVKHLVRSKFYVYFNFISRDGLYFVDVFKDESNGLKYGASFEFDDGQSIYLKFNLKINNKTRGTYIADDVKLLKTSKLSKENYDNLEHYIDIVNTMILDLCEILSNEYEKSLKFSFNPFFLKDRFEDLDD